MTQSSTKSTRRIKHGEKDCVQRQGANQGIGVAMTPASPSDIATMRLEWEAWQRVVGEWRRRFPKLDFNADENAPFLYAVAVWGEELAVLRMQQGSAIVHEKEKVYVEVCRQNGLKPVAVRTAQGYAPPQGRGRT